MVLCQKSINEIIKMSLYNMQSNILDDEFTLSSDAINTSGVDYLINNISYCANQSVDSVIFIISMPI